MSNPNFPEINPNINPNYADYLIDLDNYLNNHQEFDVFNNNYDGSFDQQGSTSNAYLSQSPITQEMTSTESADTSLDGLLENTNIIREGIVRGDVDVNNVDEDDDEHRVVAFRIKTGIELDDGYKWRKYGKKKVKSNINPRNYYKCSSERCTVKKRVEKDPKDPSYVLISYEGTHNHQSPTHIIHIPQIHHSHLP